MRPEEAGKGWYLAGGREGGEIIYMRKVINIKQNAAGMTVIGTQTRILVYPLVVVIFVKVTHKGISLSSFNFIHHSIHHLVTASVGPSVVISRYCLRRSTL